MSAITIDALDDDTLSCLHKRAKEHGHSVEQEVAQILQEVTSEKSSRKGLGDAIRDCFADLGGVELEPLPKQPPREPPRFE